MDNNIYKDVPITAAFARYVEGSDTPVALILEVATGAILMMPFTGSRVYVDRLGGGDLCVPAEAIKSQPPAIMDVSLMDNLMHISGKGKVNSEVTVTIPGEEPLTAQTDEWGRWTVTAELTTGGEKTISVEQMDRDDRKSDPSEPVKVEADPLIGQPKPVEPVTPTPPVPPKGGGAK